MVMINNNKLAIFYLCGLFSITVIYNKHLAMLYFCGLYHDSAACLTDFVPIVPRSVIST